MELALGTVQFGLRYGVAGRDAPVPETEVRDILQCAAGSGIRTLDTAAVYGDIEARLARLIDDLPFDVVTKLPPLPSGLGNSEAARWVDAALVQARTRLGAHLHSVMFHHADDLLGSMADTAWDRCTSWAAKTGCNLGVSCYDTTTLARICERFPVKLAQLPGNAFDQRLRTAQFHPPGVELHLRSAFLQGLLLMPEHEAARMVPRAGHALARWHAWLHEHNLAPLEAALGVVKGLPGVTHCVVGVDDRLQLEAIVEAWCVAPTLHATELALADLTVIDPRCWPRRV